MPPQKLTPHEIDSARAVFEKIDVNHSESLDFLEVKAALQGATGAPLAAGLKRRGVL